MSLTLMAFWLAYIGGVATAVFNPVIGVFLYILVYHLNPETQWWGSSVQVIGLRTSFTVAVATAVGVLIRWPRMLHGARQFPLPYALAIVLCLMALGSFAWGVGISERSQFQLEKLAKILIFVGILIRCVRTPLQYHGVILAWLIGVLYLGYEAQGGIGLRSGGRLSGGLGGPDFAESSGLAVHIVATLPLIGAMFFMARSWLGRLFMLGTGALTVNLLILTRTRNAIAGLAPMALACVLSLPRGYRLKGVLGVIIGTLLAIHLTDDGWWRRMESVVNYREDNSAMMRLTYWKAAIDMVFDYPLGIGIGNFHHTVMDYVPGLTYVRSAHNSFFACLAELGWPGLLVFCTLLFVTLRRLAYVRNAARQLPEMVDISVFGRHTSFHLGWHAVALRAGIVGYMGCSIFTTRLYAEDQWLLIGLAACLYNVSLHMVGERELAESVAKSDRSHGARPAAAPPADSFAPIPPVTARE
jgi:hypothetical protein